MGRKLAMWGALRDLLGHWGEVIDVLKWGKYVRETEHFRAIA